MTGASVTITGRTTAAPELRHTQNGLPVANFTVAHTPRRQNASGEWEDSGHTLFLRVTAWRELGENAASSLGKGDVVTVTGRLGVRFYKNAAGVEQMEVTCDADSVSVDLRRQTVEVSRTVARSADLGLPDTDAWAAPAATAAAA